MKIRNVKSIIIILVYLLVNGLIVWTSIGEDQKTLSERRESQKQAPEYTVIEQLDYFHLKQGIPQLSLTADGLTSQGEEFAEFVSPRGVYNYQQKNKAIRYSAVTGSYRKPLDTLTLKGDVEVKTDEAEYYADRIKYLFKKDLLFGTGNVKFSGDDPKTRDHLSITSHRMKARPEAQVTEFKGNVQGTIERKKKYEGTLNFSSHELLMEAKKSLAHLEGEVLMKREGYLITAGKADVYLENFNKSLKYFVLNDDVKLTETVNTPQGTVSRKAFAERLEGFGREEKMILSGAPRVEIGKDVIRGYRITIRENTDLVEVDDAMSDVQVKREKKLKE